MNSINILSAYDGDTNKITSFPKLLSTLWQIWGCLFPTIFMILPNTKILIYIILNTCKSVRWHLFVIVYLRRKTSSDKIRKKTLYWSGPVNILKYWPAALTKTNRENKNVKYNIVLYYTSRHVSPLKFVSIALNYKSAVSIDVPR